MLLNAPRTLEGAEVWQLAMRSGGQLRVADGAVIGYDMAAIMMLGEAMGICRRAISEFMPKIEGAAATEMNRSAKENQRPSNDG